MARILIIDDEDVFREDLASLLRLEGHECQTVADGEQGLEVARSYRPSVVLCDHIMPGMLGTEVIEHLVSEHPDCAVLVITAHATVDMAVKAFRLGALDVVLKPIVPQVLLRTLERISEQQRLRTEVGNLRRALVRRTGTLTMVGKSPAMQELRSLVERVAPHRSPVLISGENGTGKELVAQSIHQAGPNGNGPFVAVNCSAITDTLFESELFGHVKGAFTGAEGARKGYFETAAGGTLLFDEVGEAATASRSPRRLECWHARIAISRR
jgi:DNA-binding NtrC family response regulator